MSSQAVGLNEVGGVTRGANATLDARGIAEENARRTDSMANDLAARNYGPASRAQFASGAAQAAAGSARAAHSAEYAVQKAQGERDAVQGHEEATQIYSTAATQGDTAARALNRPL